MQNVIYSGWLGKPGFLRNILVVNVSGLRCREIIGPTLVASCNCVVVHWCILGLGYLMKFWKIWILRYWMGKTEEDSKRWKSEKKIFFFFTITDVPMLYLGCIISFLLKKLYLQHMWKWYNVTSVYIYFLHF